MVPRHEPEAWSRGRTWFSSNSYVAAKLTGEYVIDHHTASQSDPLYDVRAYGWIDEWVPEIVGGLEMPRLVWPQDVIGTVTAQAAGGDRAYPPARRSPRARSMRGPRRSPPACASPVTSC